MSKLLAESGDAAVQQIVVIGAGGVTSADAVARMHRAGAQVVGSATLFGKLGVSAFEQLAAPQIQLGDIVLEDTCQIKEKIQ